MPLPTWVPGQVLASADVNNYFVPQVVVKTSSTVRSGTTTLTADPALTITLAAGGLYEIRCMVYYSGASAAGFLQWNWTIPGSGSFSYQALYAAQGGGVDTEYSSSVAGVMVGGASSTGPAWTSGTGTPWCNFMTGLANGGTGGALTFNWAQSASNATGTSVLLNSYLIAQRIAT